MKAQLPEFALLLAGCIAGLSCSAATAGDSEKIARLAADSAAGLWSASKQGTLHAKISVESASPMNAEVVLTWREDDIKLEVMRWERTTRNSEGVVALTKSPTIVCLCTAKESWSYHPEEKSAYGYAGQRRQTIPGELDVRPRVSYLGLPYFPGKTYQKLFTGPKLAAMGIATEPGLYRFGSDPLRITVDEKKDFLPVLTESHMHGPTSEEHPSPFVASYEWSQDPHGTSYCKMFQLQEYSWQRMLTATTRIEVIAYESRPTKEALNFTIDGLVLPKGTAMRYADGRRSRSWKHQEKVAAESGIFESDYRQLIESAQSSGFSSDSRSAR